MLSFLIISPASISQTDDWASNLAYSETPTETCILKKESTKMEHANIQLDLSPYKEFSMREMDYWILMKIENGTIQKQTRL